MNTQLQTERKTGLPDVIIIGGSYAGLAAGMSLGRALRGVLIIDNGRPCNRQTPHSHNFLTNDGKTPAEIAGLARLQVEQYPGVQFFTGTAVKGRKTDKGFEIEMETAEKFYARHLVFATGIKDMQPGVDGLADCWGISALHCPYCHGYEVQHKKTAILGNGEEGFNFARMIANWTKDLTLFTNGGSLLFPEQIKLLQSHGIDVIETPLQKLHHDKGYLKEIVLNNGHALAFEVLYAPSPFEQHCIIPEMLGCLLNEEGYIRTDASFETSIPGVYAIGDNASKMRTVANAVAMGNAAGIMLGKKIILANW